MAVTIVLPPVSEDKVTADLRYLTEILMTFHDAETSGGFLGGEYGYGADFENDTFMMHPYCWCDQTDCPWCLGCTCPDAASRYYFYDAPGVEVDADTFFDSGGYTAGGCVTVTELQCDYCAGRKTRAANFLHKPSGSTVNWYKYLSRGMEVDLRTDWTAIFNDCLTSLATPAPAQDQT